MRSRQLIRPWLVCLGGTVMLLSNMGLGANVYSVYQPYIIAQNGFTVLERENLFPNPPNLFVAARKA